MNTHIKHAFGYHIAGPSFREDPTPLGIYTLVFGSPKKPYIQKIGRNGSVVGFTSIPAVAANEFVAIKTKTAVQVGHPHLLALVTDAAVPQDVAVLPWHKMADKVLTLYPTMSASLLKHPLAGLRVANFVLALAPAYAAAAKPWITVDFEHFGPELDLIASHDAKFRRDPLVQQLAKDSEIDLKPDRETEILP